MKGRYKLDKDWEELDGQVTIGWSVPVGTTYTYLDTVDYFDWFKALVAFDADVTLNDGRVLPAGTPLRTGYGITNFSTKEGASV